LNLNCHTPRLAYLEDAPVALGTTLEIVDLIFQDLIVVSTPFGGKVVALGGNFRQVLPVIRKRSRCAKAPDTLEDPPIIEDPPGRNDAKDSLEDPPLKINFF
jgi:hypothetical protein